MNSTKFAKLRPVKNTPWWSLWHTLYIVHTKIRQLRMWVISGLILSSNFQLHFRWKFLVQVLWKSEFWMNVKFIFFVINDPCRIFNPEEGLFFTSLIWQKCLKFREPKSSDINKRELRYTIKGTYQNMSKSRKNVFYLPT